MEKNRKERVEVKLESVTYSLVFYKTQEYY